MRGSEVSSIPRNPVPTMIAHQLSNDKRLRTVTISGAVSSQEFLNYRKEVIDERNLAQIASFVDFTLITEFQVGFAEVNQHADAMRELNSQRAVSITEVILAPTDLGFGFARMYQTMSEGRLRVLVFRDEVKAKAALAEILASGQPTSES